MRHKTKYGSGHTYKGTTSVTAAQRQAKLNSLLAMLKRQGLTVVVDYQTDDEGPIALITAI